MSKIKILVACHKQVPKLKSSIMDWIQVGAANHKEHFESILHDDDGENISSKNPSFCELTAQYWAWRNLKADYYGFFHYRRYFNFSEKRYITDGWGNVLEEKLSDQMQKKYGLTDNRIEQLVTQYDLIIAEEKDVKKMPSHDRSVYEQYKNGNSLHIEDLDMVCEIVSRKYPEYKEDLEQRNKK